MVALVVACIAKRDQVPVWIAPRCQLVPSGLVAVVLPVMYLQVTPGTAIAALVGITGQHARALGLPLGVLQHLGIGGVMGLRGAHVLFRLQVSGATVQSICTGQFPSDPCLLYVHCVSRCVAVQSRTICVQPFCTGRSLFRFCLGHVHRVPRCCAVQSRCACVQSFCTGCCPFCSCQAHALVRVALHSSTTCVRSFLAGRSDIPLFQ